MLLESAEFLREKYASTLLLTTFRFLNRNQCQGFRARVRVPSATDVQYFHMGLCRNASGEEGNSQVTLKWIQDKRIPAESRFRAHDTVWNKQDLISDIT